MTGKVIYLRFHFNEYCFTMNSDLPQDLLMNLKTQLEEHYKAKISTKDQDSYYVECDKSKSWVMLHARLIEWFLEYGFELKIFNESIINIKGCTTMIFIKTDKK